MTDQEQVGETVRKQEIDVEAEVSIPTAAEPTPRPSGSAVRRRRFDNPA